MSTTGLSRRLNGPFAFGSGVSGGGKKKWGFEPAEMPSWLRALTRRAAPSGPALGTPAFGWLDALARASGTAAALRQRDRDGGRLQGCLALDEIELGGRGAANQRSRPCEVVVRDEVEARQSA